MNRLVVMAFLTASFGLAVSALSRKPDNRVLVVADEAHKRVDITIDGKPFTSYIWPTSLKKPVLYPLIDDEGIAVTRGYPLEPRPDERVDHPHTGSGSTMEMSMASISGITRMPSNRKTGRRWGQFAKPEFFPQRADPIKESLSLVLYGYLGTTRRFLNKQRGTFFASNRPESLIWRSTLKADDRVVFSDNEEGLLGMLASHDG